MASAHSMSMFSLPFSNSTELAVAYKVYFVVCISGACVGLFGAAIFLYRLKSEETTITRRRMLILLGVSDLLADMGVIVKSAYWLIGTANVANSGRPLPVLVGGAVLEYWVLFWYLSTFFFTFFYVAEIYNSRHSGQWRSWYSCCLAWFFCLLFTSFAALIVWTGDPLPIYGRGQGIGLDGRYKKDFNLIAYLACLYGPLLVVLTALPFFFFSVIIRDNSKHIVGLGEETARSHQQMLSTVIAFYLSWILSGLDGVILISAHVALPLHPTLIKAIFDTRYIYIIWLLEGLLNPLQSLLRVTLCWCMAALCRLRHRVQDRRFNASGECITVDFRHGRGNVKHIYADKHT